MRRGVEQLQAENAAVRRKFVEMNRSELVRELEELIAALDSRAPRVERAGEASIARDAAALKEKALKRLAALTAGSPPPSA